MPKFGQDILFRTAPLLVAVSAIFANFAVEPPGEVGGYKFKKE